MQWWITAYSPALPRFSDGGLKNVVVERSYLYNMDGSGICVKLPTGQYPKLEGVQIRYNILSNVRTGSTISTSYGAINVRDEEGCTSCRTEFVEVAVYNNVITLLAGTTQPRIGFSMRTSNDAVKWFFFLNNVVHLHSALDLVWQVHGSTLSPTNFNSTRNVYDVVLFNAYVFALLGSLIHLLLSTKDSAPVADVGEGNFVSDSGLRGIDSPPALLKGQTLDPNFRPLSSSSFVVGRGVSVAPYLALGNFASASTVDIFGSSLVGKAPFIGTLAPSVFFPSRALIVRCRRQLSCGGARWLLPKWFLGHLFMCSQRTAPAGVLNCSERGATGGPTSAHSVARAI